MTTYDELIARFREVAFMRHGTLVMCACGHVAPQGQPAVTAHDCAWQRGIAVCDALAAAGQRVLLAEQERDVALAQYKP